jgi:hypothetical protein
MAPFSLEIKRFDYRRLGEELATVRLLATLAGEDRLPADPSLTIFRGAEWTSHPARACRTDGLVWHAAFAVPLAIVEYPQSLFALNAAGCARVALPAPALVLERELRRGWLPPAHVARRLATIVTVLSVGAAAAPAVSSAVTPAWSQMTPQQVACLHHQHPRRCLWDLAHLPSNPGAGRAKHSKGGTSHKGSGTGRGKRHAGGTGRSGGGTEKGRQPSGGRAPQRHSAPPSAPAPVVTSTAPSSTGSSSSLPGDAAQLSRLSGLLAKGNQPPMFLIPIYKAAGRRYHVPWRILAAINWIETDYGRNLNVSSAGAIGWMQFMPSTWLEWGVSADGHGRPNAYDPRDAIFSAARYLAASGAQHNLRGAIFAYNHATWYVDEVMFKADLITAGTRLPKKGDVRAKVEAMIAIADVLSGKPYIWGGGHGDWQIGAGYDCSGFVSAVLHAAGFLTTPQTTDTLPSQPEIRPGPGDWVTIFDRTDPGGHVIIDLDGTFYESGGSTSAGGGAGVKRFKPPISYLATFNRVLHPAGL